MNDVSAMNNDCRRNERTGGGESCSLLAGPRLEPLLGHLQVLDMGGGTVQKRNLAGLLVSDVESTLEVTVTVPELIASPLFRLNALATNFLVATGIDA